MKNEELTGIYIVTDDREFEDPDARMTFTLHYQEVDPGEPILNGILKTEAMITKLERIITNRYRITGIEILAADFGSHSDDIVYNFRARGFDCFY